MPDPTYANDPRFECDNLDINRIFRLSSVYNRTYDFRSVNEQPIIVNVGLVW